MAERERTPLNENSTLREVVDYLRRGNKIFADICIAARGMTWDEHERLHGKNHEEEQ